MKSSKIFAALLILTSGAWAATPSDIVLPEKLFSGLDGILKVAAEQSPRMVNRVLDLQIAEDDRIMARSGLLPGVSTTYRIYEARDKRADLPDRLSVQKTYYDISLTQPIFYWGERRNNARMGEIRQKISQGNYRDGYRLLAQELRNLYLQLIIRKVTLERARFNQRFAKEQLVIAEDRLAKKVISGVEIFPLRLNSERADVDLERTIFDYENNKATFARLAGLAEIKDSSIPNEIPIVTTSGPVIDQLLADFLSQKSFPTTEAFALRNQIEIQNLDYLNQKTRLRPKFSLSAGTNQDEQSFTLNTAQKFRVNSYFVGVQVQWTLFDGFASQAATRISLARRRQMENDYRDLTERLAQQAQSQARLAYFSARNMSINDRFLTAGEGNLKSKQDEFKRGAISEADVSLAQLGLYDSQVNAFGARADYLLKVGDFLGTLAEDPALNNVAGK